MGMGCRELLGPGVIVLVILFIALTLASTVTADPDPPVIDGGVTTFQGDWVVDFGDRLTYINQTIVLDGNLTIDDNGTLGLVNCTLVLNCTFTGEFGFEVLAGGRLNVTAGSTLTRGAAGMSWHGIVNADGHILVSDSTVQGVGYVYFLPDRRALYSAANDTIIIRSSFQEGNGGLVLDGVDGARVSDTTFTGPCRVGLEVTGGSTAVLVDNLTFDGVDNAIRIVNTIGQVVTDPSVQGGGYGLLMDNASVTMFSGAFRDIAGDVALYQNGGSLEWRVVAMSELVNCSLDLNGTLEVRSGGGLSVLNSTLAIMNTEADGINGITVLSGGSLTMGMASEVARYVPGLAYHFDVLDGGHLTLEGANVSGAGWTGGRPGLVLWSQRNVVNGSSLGGSPVGLTVLGDDNHITGVTIHSCEDGIRWSGSNSTMDGLTITSCSSLGITIESATNVSVTGANISHQGSVIGVLVDNSFRIDLAMITVTGPPMMAFAINASTNVSMTDVNAMATHTAITIDGGGISGNLTIASAILSVAERSINITSISGVVLTSITSTNSSIAGILGFGVVDLQISDCRIEGSGNAINLSLCDGVLVEDIRALGTRTAIVLKMVSSFHVRNSILADGGRGLSMKDCLDGMVRSVTVTNTSLGFVLDGSSRVNLTDCTVDRAMEAFILQQGTDNCTISSAVIVTTWRVLRAQDRATTDNTVTTLVLLNVTNGFMFNGVGPNHTITNCTFTQMEYVVSVVSGSVEVIDCSFYDCDHPFWTDPSSWVVITVTEDTEMVNSTLSIMTGEFRVMAGSHLNISSSEVRFQSGGVLASVITAEAGSDLRIFNGSRIEWLVGYLPGFINASGDLVLVDAVIVRGGMPGGPSAVTAGGPSAVISNVTFSECQLALTLAGQLPLVQDCVFYDNRQSILLEGAHGARVLDCVFGPNDDLWDLQGEFSTSMVIDNCTFEGADRVATAILLMSTTGETPSLELRNVTISNYTSWGLKDLHNGTLVIVDCRLFGADLWIGEHVGGGVSLDRLTAVDSLVTLGENGFTVTRCSFTNSTLKVSNNSEGSLVSDCAFTGGMASGSACLEVDGSLSVTIDKVSIMDAPVGLRLFDGSDVYVLGLVVQRTTVTAVEVNGSIVRMEGCSLSGLTGSGIRSWNVGSRAEVRNGTITAMPGRSGLDVDASNGGDVWLLNTIFNTSSVDSSVGGRVEVLWFVTIEPKLPWGGVLEDVESFTVTDATGTEVVNTTHADAVIRLFQFSDENGHRAMHTPHAFLVSDTHLGVRYSGDHIINASVHLVLDLVDVASPVARAGPDQVVDEDTIVTLNATGSSDNDPTFSQSGTYQWTFDEYGTGVVLDDEVARYVFSVPGKYWINLTVTDSAGNVGRDTVIVQVRDRTPPMIIFNGNVTISEDLEFVFDASATTDNDPSFDADTGTFSWEIDLVVELLERDTASFGQIFPDPGNYTGVLKVWDRTGNMAQEEFWVHIMDVTPPVIEGISDALVFEPLDGLLDASGCHDNVGIISFEWTVTYEFEPGSPVALEGVTPSFTFDQLGTYLVQLTLSDAAGNTNSTISRVVYDDVPIIVMYDWAVAMVGERFSVPVHVSDIYYDELVVQLVSGPEGAFIEGPVTSSRLVWTPNAVVVGEDVVIGVEVDDGFTTSQMTITVHVNPARGNANNEPVLRSDPPRDAKRDTPYVYRVEAEDDDGDVLWYLLTKGPEGMSISQEGTITWDPPYEQGTVLVEVQVNVTDGRDITHQVWTIRWREPPNRAPSIPFSLPPIEVLVHESFQVDLSVYVQDPQAYDVDEDDPNHALEWEIILDGTMVTLVEKEGLVFYLRSLEIAGTTMVNFTVVDPSGAKDLVAMDLAIQRPPSVDDEDAGWLLWAALAAVLIVVVAVVVVARTRQRTTDEHVEMDRTMLDRAGGPQAPGTGAEAVGEIGAFVELEKAPPVSDAESSRSTAVTVPGGSRVIDGEAAGTQRTFHLEGVALLDGSGAVLASTGPIRDIFGPYQDALDKVRAELRGDGVAVLELEGHRGLVVMRPHFGMLCLVRGREDGAFREQVIAGLDRVSEDRSEEAYLAVVEDMISLAGAGVSAEVVHDAWTSRLRASLSYVGSMVMLEVRVRNDTERILHNMKLEVEYDTDALHVDSVEPKLLATHGVFAIGNVPSRKKRRAKITFMPELCISSIMRVMGMYTDSEGLTVYVPSRGLPVRVECPFIEAGGQVDEGRVLAMAEEGLGHKGFRVLTHGIDVDHLDLFKMAVRLVGEKGPIKVIDLDDETLMRAEAWFLGSGHGGAPQVLIRVSSHGADRLMELFVTSDDGATTTGLLTHLMGEVLDKAASEMPGKRVERVKEASTLDEIEVWPTLLDYKVMGE